MTDLLTERPTSRIVKNPDTFIKVEIGELESLDPSVPYDTRSWEVMANVYETLFVYSRERRAFLPRLAEAVPSRENGLVSEDERVYRIPIRPRVRFHDAQELRPDDVAYSLRRLLLRDHPDGPAWMLLEPLFQASRRWDGKGRELVSPEDVARAVRVEGASVVLSLAQPFAPLLAILSTPATSVVSRSWAAANGEWSGDPARCEQPTSPLTETHLHAHMNGTGSYRLVSWRPGEVRLERHDDYWRGAPPLRHARLVKENDWPRRRELLISGEADMVQTDGTYLPEVERLPGVRVYDDLALDVCDAISFNLKIDAAASPFVGTGRLDGDGISSDFFTDLHVRRGFTHAFDRRRAITEVHLGRAEEMRGPIPGSIPGAGPVPNPLAFDLALAEQELCQAWGGRLWETGFRCTALYTEGNALRQGWVRILAEGLARLNSRFRLEIASIDLADKRRSLAARQLPLYTIGWLVDYPDPHNFAQPIMASKGVWARWQSYHNETVDELVDAAGLDLDSARRESTYTRIQEMARDEAKDIYTVRPLGLAVLRDWVHGWSYDLITGPQAITLVGELDKRAHD